MTQNVNKRPRRSKRKSAVFLSGHPVRRIRSFPGSQVKKSSPSIEPPCNFKKCLDVRVRQHQHLAAFNNFLLFSPMLRLLLLVLFGHAATGSAAKVTASGMQMRRHICQFVDRRKSGVTIWCHHGHPGSCLPAADDGRCGDFFWGFAGIRLSFTDS